MKPAAAWTSPADIRARLRQMWDDGRLLSARASGTAAFPLPLPLRRPSVAQLGERFDEVRAWIRALEEGSRARLGHGYDIVWREINHRQLGRNRVPDEIVVPGFDDAVRLLGCEAAVRRFDRLAALSVAAFPALAGWIARRPLDMLERAAEWERVLACLRWFAAHPRAGLYLRQLDIPGVDSKFIETRKALLAELLDCVLPLEAIEPGAIGARQFELRYGLRARPATIRFRLLDPDYALNGLTDLSVPVQQFAALRSGVERVYITENEVNFIAFPDTPRAMVIFGGGYAIDRLADVPWLGERQVVYWGDIDTHGFAILDRLRASLPQVRSMLMDAPTLHAHRELWGQEELGKRYLGELQRLSTQEQELFDALRSDALGIRVRLEQERIAYGWVETAASSI